MNRKSWLWMVGGMVVALGILWQFAAAQGDKTQAAGQWEYRVEYPEDHQKIHDVLKKAGDERWELVAVEPGTPYARSPGNVERARRLLYFKRPK